MSTPLAPAPVPMRIESPRVPAESAAPRFPIVAAIAPVVASLGLFVFTRSPFALAFAFLGPVVAIGSLVDARLQRRRSARRDRARFDGEWDHARDAIIRAHEAERERLERRFPSLSRVMPNWSSEDEVMPLRVGTGRVPGSVALTSAGGAAVASPYRDRLEKLAELARQLAGAPLCVDAAVGVTVRGDRAAAQAIARAIVLRWAASLSPERFHIERPPIERGGADWSWVDDLPHPVVKRAGDQDGVAFVRRNRHDAIGGPGSTASFAVTVGTPDGPSSGSVLTVHAAGQAVLTTEKGSIDFSPDLAAMAQARSMASKLQRMWSGMTQHSELPVSVSFGDLSQSGSFTAPASSDAPESSHVPDHSLRAVIGRSREGEVDVDLVSAGPHAIVGGTTGSGKSELLLSWILGMAAHRSPTEVTFLFVDYKGGASFGPLARLPHSVGVLTDLDDEQSARALASLTAELRFRERELAGAGLRSIDEHPPIAGTRVSFPRLVVVVDEFAALIDGNAELHRLFLDLASRGRSLGVHLILCTQRPAGVVRDGILANSGLRMSLRVTNGSDSVAVIGTDDAARLPTSPRGRALVAEIGTPPIEIQVAWSTPADAEQIIDRWSDSPVARRPWCPPLASVIPMPMPMPMPIPIPTPTPTPTDGALAGARGTPVDGGAAVPFGMIDLPEQQLQRMIAWEPRNTGALVVIGAARSGRSMTLATLARACSGGRSILVDPDLPSCWDALDRVCGLLDAAPERISGQPSREIETLLLLDDFDAVFGSAPDDYAAELLNRVARIIREGGAHGISVAFSVQRLNGQLSSLAALCGSRLILRLADRQDHLLAGGDSDSYSSAVAPGGGWWGGNRVQVFCSEPVSADQVDPPLPSRDVSLSSVRDLTRSVEPGVAIVSAHPEATMTLLTEGWQYAAQLDFIRVGHPDAPKRVAAALAAGRHPVWVGDPDAWQADWALLSGLRRQAILFDGCSLVEVRAITRARVLPPPFSPRDRVLWIKTSEGEFRRVRP